MHLHPRIARLIPDLLVTYRVDPQTRRASITRAQWGGGGQVDLEGAQVSHTGGGPLLLGVGDIEITGRNTTRLVWEKVFRPERVAEELRRIASGESGAGAGSGKDGAADKGRGKTGSAGAGGAGAAQTGGEGPRAVFVEHVTPRRRAQSLFPHPYHFPDLLVWDPNERWFATGGSSTEIVLWPAETARPLMKIKTSRYREEGLANDMVVSPDGR